MRNRLPVLLALLIPLSLPASAGAVGWVTGAPLSPAGRVAIEPKVAITPSGERIVAWQELQAGTDSVQSTVVRVAPPGGEFGPPQTFASGDDEDLSVAVGSDGTAAVVWSQSVAANTIELHVARQAPGQAGFTESTPAGLAFRLRDAPQVAIAGGDVYVALDATRLDGNVETTAIQAVRLAAGSGQLQALNGGASLDTARFDTSNQPSSVADGAHIAVEGGTVHVIWEFLQDAPTTTGSGTTVVRRATAPAGGGNFGTPIQVDNSTTPSFFRAEAASPVIAAGHGRVDLAWVRSGGEQIGYQELTTGGGPQHIDAFAASVHAGVDATGALLLAWQAFTATDGSQGVFAATVPPGGPAGTPTRLTPLGGNRQLDDFAVGDDGSALAVPDQANFESFSDSTEHVQASFRAPGAAFGGLEEVSGTQDRTGNATFSTASAALGSGGRALIAWIADDGSGVANSRVFVSERDAVAPVFGAIRLASTGVAGRPVSFSAAATDTLSAVTINWDFGDGAHARGTAVTHAYGAAGTYTVTVSARDGEGNVATQTRTVGVADPRDTTAPTITRLRVTNARFRTAGDTAALIAASRRIPAGTSFKLALSERATVVLSLRGRVAGRRAGSHCVAAGRRGRRCVVALDAGTIIRAGRGPGNVTIPFSGRVDGRSLPAGADSASVVAIDGAGNRSRPRTVRFTVVSR
jgi:PKD repeat protein